MTTAELADLLAQRNAALDHQTHRLSHAEAAENDRTYRAADAAIVAELRRRKGPVTLSKIKLHLTADRASFVEVDPATGRAIYDHGGYQRSGSLLYRYPEPAAQRRGEGA